jgi:hypothetical protein
VGQRQDVARRPLITSQRRETVCFASLIDVALNWQQCGQKIWWSRSRDLPVRLCGAGTGACFQPLIAFPPHQSSLLQNPPGPFRNPNPLYREHREAPTGYCGAAIRKQANAFPLPSQPISPRATCTRTTSDVCGPALKRGYNRPGFSATASSTPLAGALLSIDRPALWPLVAPAVISQVF